MDRTAKYTKDTKIPFVGFVYFVVDKNCLELTAYAGTAAPACAILTAPRAVIL